MANLVPLAKAAQASRYAPIHIATLLRKQKIAGQKVDGAWLVDLDSLHEYEQRMQALGNRKYNATRPK